LTSLSGGQLRLKIRQYLFKSSSIILKRDCLLFNKMSGGVDAGLVTEELRALPEAIYYLLGRIYSGDGLRLSDSTNFIGQIGSLAIAANFALVHGIGPARDKIKGFTRVLAKYSIGLVMAIVCAKSFILQTCAPG